MTASAVDHRASIIPAVYRHSLLVRVTHWINVLCLTLLLMSGLQIFNAHSALYWGQASDFSKPILAITARDKRWQPVRSHRGARPYLRHDGGAWAQRPP